MSAPSETPQSPEGKGKRQSPTNGPESPKANDESQLTQVLDGAHWIQAVRHLHKPYFLYRLHSSTFQFGERSLILNFRTWMQKMTLMGTRPWVLTLRARLPRSHQAFCVTGPSTEGLTTAIP